GVAVEVRQPEAPAVALVDPGQMKTVTVNLLLNALDAMPRGGRLLVELGAEAGGAVRLQVSDSGTGIAAGVAERLFRPFVTTKPTGTGLGLSICRRVLESHGGRIEASNRPDGGACFTVTLPGAA